MLDEVERTGDAGGLGEGGARPGERIMGFGHRVYRAEDPRARVLRRAARELDAPRFEAAEALERAALEELRARKPDRVLATNVEYWSAVVLDRASVPQDLFTRAVRVRAQRGLVGARARAAPDRAGCPADGRVRWAGAPNPRADVEVEGCGRA